MSTMSDAPSNVSRPVQRTNTGRTGTSGGYGATTTQQTTTEGTRTETTGISRNHSMKTTTTGTHHRGGATVSRNTSMTSATRTVLNEKSAPPNFIYKTKKYLFTKLSLTIL